MLHTTHTHTFSWPAVSQIWNFITFSSTLMVLDRNDALQWGRQAHATSKHRTRRY